MTETVAALLADRAADDRVGLRFGDETWTWREVVSECRLRADWLAARADGRPLHVGVLLDNVPDFVFLLGGAALARAVVVGINPTRRGEELATDIRHTDCRVIITDDDHRFLLDGLDLGGAEVCDVAQLAAGAGAGTGVTGRPPQTGTEPDGTTAQPDDLYLLLFTSGSTGTPKAVRMSQGRAARTAARSNFGPDDVLYCSMPLFHGNSLHACVFPAMRSGATLVLRRKFSATAFLADLRHYGATFFNTVGRALAYVLATEPTAHDRDHLVKYGLGPESSQADVRAFRQRFGIYIVEGYGSSENAIILAPAPGMPKGALGAPLPGADIAVVDPATGTECEPARFDADGRLLNATTAIGELVGRNVAGSFEGYYNNPLAEAERTRNGWYWSGDLAYRDEDGWFWFAGRSADWLRVDGENFAAAPVERILQRLPGARGVAVYGVPDPVTGDQVMAAFELDTPFDPEAFDAFLAHQADLGTKWAPRFVRIVAELPLTGTNKVDKQPLRRERWATTDVVWWRPERADAYRRMTDDDRAALTARFTANNRHNLLEA